MQNDGLEVLGLQFILRLSALYASSACDVLDIFGSWPDSCTPVRIIELPHFLQQSKPFKSAADVDIRRT